MTKAQENILLVSLLLLFLAAFLLVPKIYTASSTPELDADMIPVSKSMSFGAVIDSASCRIESGKECSVDADNAKKEIDSAAAMKAGFVRFDLAGEWLDDKEELQKLDSAVSYARAKKLKISVAFWGRGEWLNFSSSLEAYGGGGKAGWEEFRKKYMEDAGSYARRYRPDYFVVLPECPHVVGNQTDSERTADEWLAFAKQAALFVRQNSYDSKIILEGFAAAGDEVREAEIEFLSAAIQNGDPSISVISMKADNLDDLEKGAKNLVRMKEKYHWQGYVWMGNIDFHNSSIFPGDSNDRNRKQKEFFLYALYLANVNKIDGVGIGSLRGRSGGDGGILEENYSPKPAYNAIKQVMANEK